MTPLAAVFAGSAAGTALGWLYFRALWSTVGSVGRRSHPAAYIVLSMLLRLSAALVVLALLARWGGLPALAAALVGFVLARTLFMRRSQRELA